MSLWPRSSLVCSINMWGEARDDISYHDRNPSCHFPRDAETLAECKVLAHWHTTFYPCTCGLRRGAAALIGYVNTGLLSEWNEHEEDTIVIDYFLYTDSRLRLTAAATLPLHCASSGNDPWSPTHKFSGWHGRSSATVTYPFPNKVSLTRMTDEIIKMVELL
jgi:hypothetical protein